MHPIISNLNTRTSDTAVLVLLQPTKGGPYCTGVNITGANLWYPPHPPQQAALDINTKINLGPPKRAEGSWQLAAGHPYHRGRRRTRETGELEVRLAPATQMTSKSFRTFFGGTAKFGIHTMGVY